MDINMYEPVSDEFLMQKFCNMVDEESIGEIFARYAEKARAVACQYLGCGSQAEDAVQDTFIKIIRKRGSYNSSQPFATWFYTVLRNVCKDHLRKRKIRLTTDIENLPEGCQVDLAPQVDVDLQLLDNLDQGERQVLQLRIVESMSFDEIALALGISTEAAKKRSQRGITKLRSLVARQSLQFNTVKAN